MLGIFCYTHVVGLIDIFFPKKCVNCKKFGDFVCTDCFIYISFDVSPICIICNRQTYNSLTHPGCFGRYTIDGAFSSVVFGRVIKKLVYNLKYITYVSSLIPFLAQLVYEGVIQQEAFARINLENAILVPVPLHAKRLRVRGYNQAELLARELSLLLSCPSLSLLERTKETSPQAHLTREKRQENIAGAFRLKKGEEKSVAHKTVLLVDDVLTSGSTLLEASKVLKKAGAGKVYGLTLAHGQ